MQYREIEPKVGKLYKLASFAAVDEIFKEEKPDSFHSRVFCSLTSGEKALLTQSILMLINIIRIDIEPHKNKVQYEFLSGDQKYISAPLFPSQFGFYFYVAKREIKKDAQQPTTR